MISILGVAVGVASIIISSSIMQGFENVMIDRAIILEGHIRTPVLCDHINIKTVSKFWDGYGILSYNKIGVPVAFKSWSDDRKFLSAEENKNIKVVSIGSELLKNAGINIGDQISITIPLIIDGELVTHAHKCTVIKSITTGMKDYDEMLVILPWKLVQNHGFSAKYELFVHDTTKLDQTIQEMGTGETWMQRHESLFNIIKTERRIVNLILFMMLSVSGMSIFSNIQLILQTRTRNIFIFKVLGMSDTMLKSIFVIIGLIIGICGTTLGILFASITILNPYIMNTLFDAIYYGPVHLAVPITEMLFVILFHIILSICIAVMPVHFNKHTLFSNITRE